MKEKDVENIKEFLKDDAEDLKSAIERLFSIVRLLRKECPWDKEQTHESLRKCMLEEAYEVCEAIDKGDFTNLREELGDVLLQVIFHSILAEEKGEFTILEVINEESDKMIRRHPHIFNDFTIKTVDKVLEKWENIKRLEKGNDSHTQILIDVPKALPSLIRSVKVQKKASEVGFDWDDISGPLAKLLEETEELNLAIVEGYSEHIEEELGDLLFSVVNLSRFVDVDPERALEKTIEKFIRRFSYIEKTSLKEGRNLEDLSLEEMDLLWEEAKEN